jgi:protein translocase SecG subunit
VQRGRMLFRSEVARSWESRRGRCAMFRMVLEVVFFLDCFALMGIILLQMSEHSGLGGAFGSGMSSTVFGRDEIKDPKRTVTVVLASAFMLLGLLLSVL